MGVDKHTTIGPYLQIKGKLEKKIPKIRRACPNHPNRVTNDKYCSLCGKEVESQEYVETLQLNARDVYYKSDIYEDDVLYFPEHHDTILPNISVPHKISLADEHNTVDLSNATSIIDLQLEWFRKTYAKEIEMFTKEFGEDKVTIGWGVVTYYS